MTYAEKLRDPRWQKKRLQILERDGWACQACGTKDKNLQVHHLFYAKLDPWEYQEEAYQTLCEHCHDVRQEIADGWTNEIRMMAGSIPTESMQAAMQGAYQHLMNYAKSPSVSVRNGRQRGVVRQQLELKDWPLLKEGDELFFGYVVAMGVIPGDWTDEDHILFADFAYNDGYDRYRLPNNDELISKLNAMLESNFTPNGGIYGKVWIKRLAGEGYDVQLP